MLKLKRVLILGFKSFCDRTDLTVPGCGIAVVAGPNGCGKSNILDSMSWALGEQRARNLRSVQMQDVIFAGTSERKPLGMAEVTLTLVDPEVYEDHGPSEPDFTVDSGKPSDWDEDEIRRQHAAETEEIVAAAQTGRVSEEVESNLSQSAEVKIRRRRLQSAPDKGEISITRRLFRTGESEYLLNGKICRLRDIQDIFASTGLGSDTYAIIGQEQIGQLLSSKPNDRRAVIEEAAGVSGLKTQKRLAELRLEGAKQNLGRVDDIFEEVSRQMGSLKRQVAKAERFASIHEELRGQLRVVLASHLTLIDSELTRLQAAIGALTKRIDDASVTIEAMESRQHSLTEVGYKLDRESQEAQNHANAIEIDLERVLSREHHVRERMRALGEWLNTSASELEQARRELSGIVREREQQGTIRDAVAGEVCSCRQRVQVRQQEMSAATDQIYSAERQMEAGRQHAMQLLALAGNARTGAIQAEESLAMLEREAERLTSELGQGREDLSNLCRDKDQAKQQLESTNEGLIGITHDIETLGRTLQAHRLEESVLITQTDALRAEQAVAAGRRLSLDSITFTGNLFNAALSNPEAVQLTLTGPATAPTSMTTLGTFSPATPTYGQPVTLSATITGGTLTPTGSVVFTVDSATYNATVVNGTASTIVNGLTAGSHTVSAAYTSSNGYASSTSTTATLVIGQATLTVTWPAPATITYGTALSAMQLDASASVGGTLTYTPPARTVLNAGTQTLSVLFTPADATDYKSVSQTVMLTINKAASSVTLTANPNPAAQGKPDVLTATVTGAGQPTGTVVFLSGATTLCTTTLNGSGVATCTFTPSGSGTLSISAQYQGDGNHLGSSAGLSLSVYDTSVSLQFASTQLTYLGATNVTVCVSGATKATPTGTVEIVDGTTVLTTLTLGGNGCAYWYISPGLNAGSHSITAVYSGDKNNPPGTSDPTVVTVSPVPVNMSVSCWNSSFPYGGNYQCTVSVSSNAGSAQGNITYSYDGGAPVAAALSGGSAGFTITKPVVGDQSVVIGYAQQTNYAAATSQTENFTVTPAPVNVALAPSTWYATRGTSITFQAAITSWSAGAPNDNGSVSFYKGATLLATVPVNASGQASYTTSSLPNGSDTITATYAGGTNYASGSSSVTITIVP